MKLLSDVNFCVIDTETTGGRAEINQVIDVAVLQFQHGQIVKKFSSLVNPGRPIPSWITMLTGIDDDMVRNAPTFAEIADPLEEILSEGVFTAHNAPFDYGFIREEFRRLGRDFQAETCCTVRVARRLLPELPSRSLGVLCEHFLIDIWDRHRAHGDAEATAYVLKSLLRMLDREHNVLHWEDLETFLAAGNVLLPKGVTHGALAALPQNAGTYFLKDAAGQLVFKGRSSNIQKRIKNLFSRKNMTEKVNRFRELVAQIEFELKSGTSS